SMVIGRTKTIGVNVTALLVTLYDPIHLAEDIAVLDLASGGRFSFVAGLGYRPIEYHAMDKDWSRRGQLMDEVIDTLLKAWHGEPFEYKGKIVQVTPKPLSRPHPMFFIGGMSKNAARRAAKFGLPFYPPMEMPDLEAFYHQELEKNGKTGFVFYPQKENSMIIIDEYPEKAWAELGEYFLREAQEYSSWKLEGVPRPSEQVVTNLNDLRAQKRYEILTPQECVDRMNTTENYTLVLHALAGGIPLDRAWQCLELYRDKVLPQLQH
ncbi:MAG: LLM class flavin-dependent oxidoreductase, partial [Pseudomonadales bacterium]